MSQNDLILRHLRHRPITALEAFELYGCLRLAARISNLKEQGHAITSVSKTSNGKRFSMYSLDNS